MPAVIKRLQMNSVFKHFPLSLDENLQTIMPLQPKFKHKAEEIYRPATEKQKRLKTIRQGKKANYSGQHTITQSSNTMTLRSDTITQSSDTITQSSNTITQSSDTITQSSNTITQSSNTITQSSNTITQSSDTITQSSDTMTLRSNTMTLRSNTMNSDPLTINSGILTMNSKQAANSDCRIIFRNSGLVNKPFMYINKLLIFKTLSYD